MTDTDKLACLFRGIAGAMDQANVQLWRAVDRMDDRGKSYYEGQMDAFDCVFKEAQRLGLPHADQGNVGDTIKASTA